MKRHLLFYYIVCYLLLVTALLAITSSYGVHRLRNHMLHEEENRLYEEACLIADEYMIHMDQAFSDITAFNKNMNSLHSYLGIRIWLTNRNGFILTDTSQGDDAVGRNILDYDTTYLDEQIHRDYAIPELLPQHCVSVVYPLTTQMELKGYIILHTTMDSINENVMDSINSLNICLLIFSLLLALALLFLGSKTLRPLLGLRLAAKEFVHGNYDHQFHIKGAPEYKELATALSFMAEELKNQESYQKHFIANISHDFRSPLTSIKGYAEALSDGTIPYENREKYLGIIIFETERLGKLTSNLLDLSQLGDKGIFLDLSVFDINSIIKHTSETFEHACLEKNIHIHLTFAQKEQDVEADLGKIQQVLYNLIDNAIKFSHSDSTIDISTEENNGKVFVSVKDYGIGIPKEEQKRIWERFFKSDSSRGKDKKGTGLGLSIVKEIILAHNENINVISTMGVGTEFIFSLKPPA